MSDEKKEVFGIDLGTTYSCIALVDEHGKPVVIPNQENGRVTPSAVFFDEDNIVVGETAKENAKIYPDDVVMFVKRNMGNPMFEYQNGDQIFKAEEISSFILRKLVHDAELHLDRKIRDVVITCPAYFGINEREATRLAGEIAGLTVRQIINEPTAAAVAFGMTEEPEDKVVLVYDLGGGTFDITMIEIKEKSIEVIVTGGDHQLGGKDWDDDLVNYMVNHFCEETGMDEDELFDDPETRQDLVLNAERAKKTLTQRAKAPVSMTHGGERVKLEITREKFEELTRHRLEKTISLTKSMLEEAAKKDYTNFDEILMVGGSTRMPQVAAIIEETFGKTPKMFDPDESVAKGAAIVGLRQGFSDAVFEKVAEATGQDVEEVKAAKNEISTEVLEQAEQEVADATGFTLGAVKSAAMDIKNVCSKSFGIAAYDGDDVEKLFNLILRNTTVPVDATKGFGTREANQETVELRIFENELSEHVLDLGKGKEIGTAMLSIPSGLPANAPIEVNFVLNEEGRLDMTARELNEGRTVKATIETNSVISGEALEEAKARGKALVVT